MEARAGGSPARADFAPTIILKAWDFATEITIQDAREHNMPRAAISSEHITNNRGRPQARCSIDGIRPEHPPAEDEDVKKVERRIDSEEKEVPQEPRETTRQLKRPAWPKRNPGKKPRPSRSTTLTHDEASRPNIPTAEFQSVLAKGDQAPVRVAYERAGAGALGDERAPATATSTPSSSGAARTSRTGPTSSSTPRRCSFRRRSTPRCSSTTSAAAPRRGREGERDAEPQFDLFADFNGVPEGDAKTEFYQHDANWTNRMILGDSLQVMASLAEREGLRGKVQCIYLDPPYGIKFNSNFQWSTTSRDVKDGKADHITREPEQVKAFRDTWRDGIHSYLTYLRDRLTVARDLLHDTGSIFVQIGDENVHRVRAVMDEVFGDGNLVSIDQLSRRPAGLDRNSFRRHLTILWYAKEQEFECRSTGSLYVEKEVRKRRRRWDFKYTG